MVCARLRSAGIATLLVHAVTSFDMASPDESTSDSLRAVFLKMRDDKIPQFFEVQQSSNYASLATATTSASSGDTIPAARDVKIAVNDTIFHHDGIMHVVSTRPSS